MKKILQITMSHYLIEQIVQKSNMRVEPWTKVVSVTGASHLESIRTLKQSAAQAVTRRADALFVMIGADAKTNWLPKKLQRDDRDYVCTGRDVTDLAGWDSTRANPFLLETNFPGFFCAGDVRHDSIKRVSSGEGEGSMAIAFVHHQYLASLQSTAHPLASRLAFSRSQASRRNLRSQFQRGTGWATSEGGL